MLKQEYNNAQVKIESLYIDKTNLQEELEKLNIISIKKDKEYIQKEKQIATYLECRKTFLGRVKYYIKSRKNKKLLKAEKEEKIEIKNENINHEKIDFIKKDYYTIEDIIKIYTKLDEILAVVKNLKSDIGAIKNRIDSMEQKIKNANLYIEEIDSHEKSIFEFWKFTNKDNNKMLNAPQTYIDENNNNNIEKVYNYEEDIKEIAIQIDKLQRNNLNENMTNSIYIATTDILEILNNKEDKELVEKSLKNLKKEAQNESVLFSKENLDIFGAAFEDSTKINMLGGNKHRETHKDKLKILEIVKDTDYKQYKKKLDNILVNIEEAIKKSKSLLTIPVYISSEKLPKARFQICNISAQNALEEELKEDKIYMHTLKIKKDMNIIYFSNIIYYDNYNKTLPLGMDVTTKCIVDISKFNLKLNNKKQYRFVEEIDSKVKIKELVVCEYDLDMEENNDK